MVPLKKLDNELEKRRASPMDYEKEYLMGLSLVETIMMVELM